MPCLRAMQGVGGGGEQVEKGCLSASTTPVLFCQSPADSSSLCLCASGQTSVCQECSREIEHHSRKFLSSLMCNSHSGLRWARLCCATRISTDRSTELVIRPDRYSDGAFT
jgi:hypothetical protein